MVLSLICPVRDINKDHEADNSVVRMKWIVLTLPLEVNPEVTQFEVAFVIR